MTVEVAFRLLLVILTSYFMGSIPTAYLIARYIRQINVFDVGSGNMGGTNVARAMGLHWGIITAALDALKGVGAILVAREIMPDYLLSASMVSAFAVISGHNWSFFATWLYTRYVGEFKIKGGKGAATALGTMFMMSPNAIPVILLLGIAIPIAIVTRYASLAVLVGFSIGLGWIAGWAIINNNERLIYIPYAITTAVLIAWRFRENITRLLEGNERKIGNRVA